MRGHVDPDTLAMFREGLLPRRKAARMAAHLAHCPQCAGVDAQLADLPALLADAPAPPMPDALTARIAAALAAEAAARSAGVPAGAAATQAAAGGNAAAQPGDATAGARGRRAKRATRAPAPGRSRLALRIATAAAAIVVIAGGGYGVSRLFSSGAAPGTAGAPAAGPVEKHPPASGPQLGPNQSGGTSPGAKEHANSSAAAGYHIVSSGTNYQSGRLAAQARVVLSQSSGQAAPHASGAPNPPARAAGLSSCLAHVAGGQRPQLVDLARYNGKPATVIVLPAGANTLRVLVVGPGCSATAKDLLASTTLHGTG